MTPNLTGAVLKGLFGRLLPDIAAVIFHEYPKERQLELIEACCAKEHEALLGDTGSVLSGACRCTFYSFQTLPALYRKQLPGGLYRSFSGSHRPRSLFQRPSLSWRYRKGKGRQHPYNHRTEPSAARGLCRDTDGDYKATREAGIPFVHAAYGFGQTENPTTPSLPRWILSHCSYRKINF